MNAYIVGDTHGTLDLAKLSLENIQRLNIQAEDVLIHLGDIGIPGFGVDSSALLDYYQHFPFQVVINMGNHENYDWVKASPIIEKFGAKGYALAENLFAPLCGEIARIGSKTFWFYPGGFSLDYQRRNWGVDIFVDELPTKERSDNALKNLKSHGQVDVVISHDGPRQFVMEHFGFPIAAQPVDYTRLSQTTVERIHPAFALDEVYRHEKPLYHRWFFGHHHRDFCHQHVCAVFNTIHRLDLKGGLT